jgi:hypothetical protein
VGRRYRKKSQTSQIVSDSVYISSKLPWWGALIFGLVSFTFFYFIAPAWVISFVEGQPSRPITQGIDMVIMRRVHWFEYLGTVCGVIGLFFTIRNYFVAIDAQKGERSLVGILSRIIGRNID